MDELVGRKLVKVVRLAWYQDGDPSDLSQGPVHLLFQDGQGLLLDSRSDWTLEFAETGPGETGWLSTYDYDFNGGRWVARDASNEQPFAALIGLHLQGYVPTFTAVDEVIGLLSWSSMVRN